MTTEEITDYLSQFSNSNNIIKDYFIHNDFKKITSLVNDTKNTDVGTLKYIKEMCNREI